MLVDPGKLSLDFTSSGPLGHAVSDSNKRAIGVMTVMVEGTPPDTKGQHAGKVRLTPVMVSHKILICGDIVCQYIWSVCNHLSMYALVRAFVKYL